MELFGGVLLGLIPLLCILALIKNQINYSIRIKWLDEVFNCEDWLQYHKEFQRLDYDSTFFDMKLSRHIPFKDYVNKRINK